MKAIQITQTGGPEVLNLAELPIPTPAPGQVLIKIAAVGVNFIEIYVREGRYKAQLPLTPGTEAAGTVVQLGEGVEGFAIGDPVASVGVRGSYAEFALVPAALLVRVPSSLDLKQAAAAMLQGMTAHYLRTPPSRSSAATPHSSTQPPEAPASFSSRWLTPSAPASSPPSPRRRKQSWPAPPEPTK